MVHALSGARVVSRVFGILPWLGTGLWFRRFFPERWWNPHRHDLYATIVSEDVAETLDRGDSYAMHDGRPGVVVRHGDERGGGVILYYRAEG